MAGGAAVFGDEQLAMSNLLRRCGIEVNIDSLVARLKVTLGTGNLLQCRFVADH